MRSAWPTSLPISSITSCPTLRCGSGDPPEHARAGAWVLSLPHEIRYLIGFDADLCREVRGIFIRAVMSWIRRRARDHGVPDGRTGAVVCVQRFDSALRLDVHFHAIVLDGVYTDLAVSEQPKFHPSPKPTDDDS